MINKVIPFKGIRYNSKISKSPQKFVCWPYDIIDKKQQNTFYKKGKYNIIKVTLGKEKRKDTSRSNKYTRAKKYLDRWTKKDILSREKEPALYIYEQIYKVPFTNEKKSVHGFIGLVKLHDYKEKKILPHEEVLNKPLADRLFLTKATNTQVSAIYSFYNDQTFTIDNLVEQFIKTNKPDINYRENNALEHRFWILKDSTLINKITRSINEKQIYIADGHHRYQTMLNYQKFYRKKNNIPEKKDHPVDYIMMFLVNSAHQGLSILPYHRNLYNIPEMKLKKLLEHIKDYFHLKVFTFSNEEEEKRERERFLYLLRSTPTDVHSFGIYLKRVKRYFLLTLKNKDAYLKMAKVNKSDFWKSLDVTIIHTLLIDYILHITAKDISNQIYIDYTKSHVESFDKVNHSKYQVGIILNPTRIDQIIKIAELSEKMPQKSTYFYPKILTGFVMNKMEDSF
ncbi:MAG: DUF1015 domain-containing protein [Spirochaetes bacterium]|nr:DUF1015 domain-containing protein [Spirochaetota bacterium]